MMNVGQSKNWNQCKWRHLVAKFITNASDANCWPNFQPMQVAPPGAKIGTNTSEATFKLISVRKNDSSYRVNTLGPLCLWQCLVFQAYILKGDIQGRVSKKQFLALKSCRNALQPSSQHCFSSLYKWGIQDHP